MAIHPGDFRVREGDTVNLRQWPTLIEPVYKSTRHYRDLLAEHVAKLSAQQECFMPATSLPFC